MKKIGIIICLIAFTAIVGMAQETEKKTKVTAEKKVEKTKKEKGTYIAVKEGTNPLIIIDGKEFESSILDIIDKDKIESVNVLKGESARELYDTTGVIIIKMKSSEKKEDAELKKFKMSVTETEDQKVKIRVNSEDESLVPVIVIDGKVAGKEALDNLSPDDIESISVLKDEKSMKKYNTEAGVILVKTKKK